MDTKASLINRLRGLLHDLEGLAAEIARQPGADSTVNSELQQAGSSIRNALGNLGRSQGGPSPSAGGDDDKD